MIVKMKFLSITGPHTDIDRVAKFYLSKYEIHLENALSELKSVGSLRPFVELNPYKEPLAKVEQFLSELPEMDNVVDTTLTEEEILAMIHDCDQGYIELKDKVKILQKKRHDFLEKLKLIEPFKPLDFDVHQVLQYQFIRFRFGRIPLVHYYKIEKYLYEDLGIIFIEGGRDEHYIYGVYFVARAEVNKIDSIFKSMHFERIYLPDQYTGTPLQAFLGLRDSIDELSQKINMLSRQITDRLYSYGSKLIGARDQLKELCRNFDVRKMAACTSDKHGDYYIICGWMPNSDVGKLLQEVKGDENVFVVVEGNSDSLLPYGKEHPIKQSPILTTPPTKLQNPKLFQPFEMFVGMYGLPSYHEMDPTIFLALTYVFIFGVMFGDVGQGFTLFFVGGLLYSWKKIKLAGIISVAGLFSAFFGFLFGSVFGFENIIEARWMHPLLDMSDLPFIGRLNTIFILAVAFGACVILLTMLFQMVNASRTHSLEDILLSANGVAGLIFYGSMVLAAVLFLMDRTIPGGKIWMLMFGGPLLMIVLKGPVTNKMKQRTDAPKISIGMFIAEAFFELLETLLSYFSNTLSFIRIGAFAVSHAAIMQVVLMLGNADSGSPNWFAIILGNLFVCLFKGLIVGIQVLRLEYYEMFSRFYKGTGRPFISYKE